MKSDQEAKIVALVLTIISIFLFYTSYNSKNMVDRLGFAIIGIWIIYSVFGSYVRQHITKILKRNDDDERGDKN